MDHPIQRTVPAQEAAPIGTQAASSIFALGQSLGTDQRGEAATDQPKPKRGRKNASDMAALADRIVKTVEACGTINSIQLAQILGSSRAYALKQLKALEKVGRLFSRQDGNVQNFAATGSGTNPVAVKASGAARGFKGFLARKAGATESPPTTLQPAEGQRLRVGLFNTGELVIEHLGTSMRLDPDATRDLVTWLAHLGSSGVRIAGADEGPAA